MSWKQVNDITFNAPTTFCSRNYRIGWKLSLFKPLLCDDGNTIFKCKSPLWTLFLLKCLHLHNFTVEKSQTNATSVILQTFWEHIWKHTVENIQTNAKVQSPFEPIKPQMLVLYSTPGNWKVLCRYISILILYNDSLLQF